jgi:hypothetical protein
VRGKPTRPVGRRRKAGRFSDLDIDEVEPNAATTLTIAPLAVVAVRDGLVAFEMALTACEASGAHPLRLAGSGTWRCPRSGWDGNRLRPGPVSGSGRSRMRSGPAPGVHLAVTLVVAPVMSCPRLNGLPKNLAAGLDCGPRQTEEAGGKCEKGRRS